MIRQAFAWRTPAPRRSAETTLSLSVRSGDRVDDPLTPWLTPTILREFGGHGRFIGKHWAIDAETGVRSFPVRPPRHPVRTIRLRGVERLFFEKTNRCGLLRLSAPDLSRPGRWRNCDSVAPGSAIARPSSQKSLISLPQTKRDHSFGKPR